MVKRGGLVDQLVVTLLMVPIKSFQLALEKPVLVSMDSMRVPRFSTNRDTESRRFVDSVYSTFTRCCRDAGSCV